jgi:hypothetical protein
MNYYHLQKHDKPTNTISVQPEYKKKCVGRSEKKVKFSLSLPSRYIQGAKKERGSEREIITITVMLTSDYLNVTLCEIKQTPPNLNLSTKWRVTQRERERERETQTITNTVMLTSDDLNVLTIQLHVK